MRVFKAEIDANKSGSSSAEASRTLATGKTELETKLKVYEEILTERDQKIVELAIKNVDLSSLAGKQKTKIKEYKRRIIALKDKLEEMKRKCVQAERDDIELPKLTEKHNDNNDELSIEPNPVKPSRLNYVSFK